jgi:hypothetical protein
MCGDLDDEERARVESDLCARFVVHARALLRESAAAPEQDSPADLTDYMERLFNDTLGRAVQDDEAAPALHRYERLSMQPVVLARLAGYIAGHLSLGEDPLRKVMEALLLGYGEAGSATAVPEHEHHHGDVYVHD